MTEPSKPARPVFVEMDWIYVVDDELTLNGIPIEWIPAFDSEVETDAEDDTSNK